MLLALGGVLICYDIWWDMLPHGGEPYKDTTWGDIRFAIILPLYLVLAALAFAKSYHQFLCVWALTVLPTFFVIIFWLNPEHSNLGPIASIAHIVFAIFVLAVTSLIYAICRSLWRRYSDEA